MTTSCVVVMGVAGSGKSTVAAELAARLGARFIEADEFHSAANRAKMASGSPLTDDDRRPWLAALRQEMRRQEQVVVACSALKRRYRDALRAAGDVRFVHLVVDRDEIVERVRQRTNHYMGVAMIDSQFDALEPPGDDETDVVAIHFVGDAASVVDAAEAALARVS